MKTGSLVTGILCAVDSIFTNNLLKDAAGNWIAGVVGAQVIVVTHNGFEYTAGLHGADIVGAKTAIRAHICCRNVFAPCWLRTNIFRARNSVRTIDGGEYTCSCLLYTSPSPRD